MSAISRTIGALFSPDPLTLWIALLVVIIVPVLLHTFFFRSEGPSTLPAIMLVGSSGSGKTSILTLFERGLSASTHTSQVSCVVQCSLPVTEKAGAAEYRSIHDPANHSYKNFLLIDTPGHAKLRNAAMDGIIRPQNLKGLVFVSDAASLSSGGEELRLTAEYLHDILLLLQKRATDVKYAKGPSVASMLIALNKMDLFTALPLSIVQNLLEVEIGNVRNSRSRALLDSGIGMDDDTGAEEKSDWLGEPGSKSFKFSQMDDFQVTIDILAGNAVGVDGPGADKWLSWIATKI